MERLRKILEHEISQRELAMKHNPLNKVEISAELDELNIGLVKLFAIPDVSVIVFDDNILKTLIEYNDYLFTFIDRDNVGIGAEKEDVIRWYNEHYT